MVSSDTVKLKVCDSDGNCCSVDPISNSKDNKFAEKGVLSTFPGKFLTDCVKSTFKKENLKVTLSKDGDDGLKIDWVKIRLASGEAQTCNFDVWLDNDDGYSTTKTITCQGIH